MSAGHASADLPHQIGESDLLARDPQTGLYPGNRISRGSISSGGSTSEAALMMSLLVTESASAPHLIGQVRRRPLTNELQRALADVVPTDRAGDRGVTISELLPGLGLAQLSRCVLALTLEIGQEIGPNRLRDGLDGLVTVHGSAGPASAGLVIAGSHLTLTFLDAENLAGVVPGIVKLKLLAQ